MAELDKAPLLADGGIDSFLFERTGRLSEGNHVYETFNVDRPDIVRQVHFAYLQAGAKCLTTNTFGANPTQLAPLGEDHRTGLINGAGPRLARESIDTFHSQTTQTIPCFVLGPVGPTREITESLQEVKDVYRDQIDALTENNIDALLLETFTLFLHVVALVESIKLHYPNLLLVVQMSARLERGYYWEQEAVWRARLPNAECIF